MSRADQAARTVGRIARDLQQAIDHGDTRALRQAADDLFDAAGLVIQAAQDLEMGLAD